ncbi:MAG: hypothetical protein ACO1OB_04795 [Archangium sp.]
MTRWLLAVLAVGFVAAAAMANEWTPTQETVEEPRPQRKPCRLPLTPQWPEADP